MSYLHDAPRNGAAAMPAEKPSEEARRAEPSEEAVRRAEAFVGRWYGDVRSLAISHDDHARSVARPLIERATACASYSDPSIGDNPDAVYCGFCDFTVESCDADDPECPGHLLRECLADLSRTGADGGSDG